MEKKKSLFKTLFPTAICYFDFWMMFLFLFVMCLFSFGKHDVMGTILSAFGAIYCMNEWDKRMKESEKGGK
jgi:hypothetical protein